MGEGIKNLTNRRPNGVKRTTLYGRDTPGHKALRKGRFSESCRAYFLTITVKDKQPLLTGDAALCLIKDLLQWQREVRFALLAFVVMPDHLHVLGVLTGSRSLSNVVRILKGRSAKHLNQLLGRTGPFWQAAFYDHAVRREESLEEIAHYIECNPVRWELVQEPSEFPYSSASPDYAKQMLGWQWLIEGDDVWRFEGNEVRG